MKKKILGLISCFFLLTLYVDGQPMLSLDDAIQIALKINYDILMARQSDAINSNNVYIGNAGMLPLISVYGTATKSLNNTQQKYSNGESVNKTNATSSNLNAYAALDWTLFDGFKMFATYNQLKVIRDQSADNLKSQVQQSVSQTMHAYYDVWYQKELFKLQQVSDSLSNDRLKIAQQRFQVGLGSKLELLQSQVDHNADRSALMKQQVALNSAKRALNQLLSRPVNTDFDVSELLPSTINEPLDSIRQKVFGQNPQLLAAAKERRIANYSVKVSQSNYYPRISLAGNYNFTKSSAEASFVLSNQTYGPAIGLIASWTIFNGSVFRHQTENEKINVTIADIQYAKVKSQLDELTETPYNIFQNNLQLQQLESDNQSAAKENLSLALQKYQVGGISGLDFQNAKQSSEDAQTRLYTAMYNTQLSQLALLELTGDLVK